MRYLRHHQLQRLLSGMGHEHETLRFVEMVTDFQYFHSSLSKKCLNQGVIFKIGIVDKT